MACVVSNNTYTSSAIELARCAEVELLHFSELKTYINKLSGGFKQDILSDLQAFLSSTNRLHTHGQELWFVVFHSLTKEYIFDEYRGIIYSVLDELKEQNRKPMNITLKYCYDFLCAYYGSLVNSSENGGLYPCFQGVYRQYQLTGQLPSKTREMLCEIESFKTSWRQYTQLFDDIEDTYRKLGCCIPFNVDELPKSVMPYIEFVSPTDIEYYMRLCCQYKEIAKNFIEVISGSSV
jgi:hypothetical protein